MFLYTFGLVFPDGNILCRYKTLVWLLVHDAKLFKLHRLWRGETLFAIICNIQEEQSKGIQFTSAS